MKHDAFFKVAELLPDKVKRSLLKLSEETLAKVTEIRMRENNVTTVTVDGENLYLTDTGIHTEPMRCIRVSAREIEDFLYRFCGGAVYAYEDTIKRGFVTQNGFRAGLCGNMLGGDGKTGGFEAISGINLRIPHHVPGCAKEILSCIAENGFGAGGLLVLAPPGVGKTTVLRDLAIGLSRDIRTTLGKSRRLYRVSIIDERSEIYIPEYFSGCTVDVFRGMEKKAGLECASRVMSPEVIICDEIGSEEEALVIQKAHFGGCAFAASMHGASPEDAFAKPAVRNLIESGVFGRFYILSRSGGKVTGTLLDKRALQAAC